MKSITCIPKQRGNHSTFNLSIDAATVFIGDSLFANFKRKEHVDIWKKYFNNVSNLSIGGDKIENALWRVLHYNFSSSNKTFVILLGTNNLQRDSPVAIVEGIKNLVKVIISRCNVEKCIVLGLLPRGSSFSNERIKAR